MFICVGICICMFKSLVECVDKGEGVKKTFWVSTIFYRVRLFLGGVCGCG